MLRGLGRKMGRMLWIEVCVVDFFVFFDNVVFLGFGEEKWRLEGSLSWIEAGKWCLFEVFVCPKCSIEAPLMSHLFARGPVVFFE